MYVGNFSSIKGAVKLQLSKIFFPHYVNTSLLDTIIRRCEVPLCSLSNYADWKKSRSVAEYWCRAFLRHLNSMQRPKQRRV